MSNAAWIVVGCVVLVLVGLSLGGWQQFRQRLGAVLIGFGATVGPLAVAWLMYVQPTLDRAEETARQVRQSASDLQHAAESLTHPDLGGVVDKARQAVGVQP